MLQQILYFEILDKLTEARKQANSKLGRSARMEGGAIEIAINCIHANIIRCGEKYNLVDRHHFCVTYEKTYEISDSDLKTVLTPTEYERFVNEILEDERYFKLTGSENALNDFTDEVPDEHDIQMKPNPVTDGKTIGDQSASINQELVEIQNIDVDAESESNLEETGDVNDILDAEEFSDIYRVTLNDKEVNESGLSVEVLGVAEEKTLVEEESSAPMDEMTELKSVKPKLSEASISGMAGILSSLTKKKTVSERLADVPSIGKDDLLQYYAAFSIYDGGKYCGQFELIAAPLDPKHPTGAFAQWVKKYNGAGFASVSKGEGKRKEECTYIVKKGNITLKMTPELRDGKFAINIAADEERDIQIDFLTEKCGGSKGHIVFVDDENETAVHLIPTDTSNNEDGYAPCFCIIENEGYTSICADNGNAAIKIGEETHTVMAKWSGDTLMAAIR